MGFQPGAGWMLQTEKSLVSGGTRDPETMELWESLLRPIVAQEGFRRSSTEVSEHESPVEAGTL